MNLQFRRSFNDSRTTLHRNSSKNNTKINFFFKNKNKMPTIILNSKNNGQMELLGKEKKYSKQFFKQKSLTLSQNQNTPFHNKTLNSKLNLRKKSTNSLNTYNNKFNNINNLEILNTSINPTRSSKKISNKFYIYQNEDNYKNQNTLYNSGMTSINPLSTISIKKKNPDDFEVSEEDKIFNQYKKQKLEKNKSKKGKTKVKIKLKKKKYTKYNPFSSYDAALVKVYKKIPKIMSIIENTKKLKGNMSLFKYQNLLMNVGTKNLNRETREKLNNKFVTLRTFSDKGYNLLNESLESIEKKEKKIIDSINTQQNYYKRKMKENNYHTISTSRNIGFLNLPNLKFHKIGNSQKRNKSQKYKYKYK